MTKLFNIKNVFRVLFAIFAITMTFATPLTAAKIFDPSVIYLTWQRAPDTTMTILWITGTDRDSDIVYYQRFGETRWHQGCGTHAPLPEGHNEYLLHTVELTGLKPNSAYRFRTGSDSVVHSFKTMPADLKQPFRFVVGGDIYHDSIDAVIETMQQAALYQPMFALLGGDIAYAGGKVEKMEPDAWKRWIDFLKAWKEHMVTPEGYMIPLLPTTSNEDIVGRYEQPPESAAFFLALFPTPGLPGYSVIDFGDYMSIWLLDSGHLNKVEGKQARWLYDTLEARQKVPHKFAVYHVPAYPARRSLNNKIPTLIRTHWVPSFEKFGVEVAFEHHDHVYKRTNLLLNNKVDPKGVLYLGDGGFGVSNPRIPVDPKDTWYLVKSSPTRHFIVGTVSQDGDNFKAVDYNGVVIDEITLKKR